MPSPTLSAALLTTITHTPLCHISSNTHINSISNRVMLDAVGVEVRVEMAANARDWWLRNIAGVGFVVVLQIAAVASLLSHAHHA